MGTLLRSEAEAWPQGSCCGDGGGLARRDLVGEIAGESSPALRCEVHLGKVDVRKSAVRCGGEKVRFGRS